MSQDAHAFLEELQALNHYTDGKIVRDGQQYACISRKMFTHAIITGRVGDYWSLGDCWCYRTYDAARSALAAWDGNGEPEGWLRNPGTGRRSSESPDEHDKSGKRVGAVGVKYIRH